MDTKSSTPAAAAAFVRLFSASQIPNTLSLQRLCRLLQITQEQADQIAKLDTGAGAAIVPDDHFAAPAEPPPEIPEGHGRLISAGEVERHPELGLGPPPSYPAATGAPASTTSPPALGVPVIAPTAADIHKRYKGKVGALVATTEKQHKAAVKATKDAKKQMNSANKAATTAHNKAATATATADQLKNIPRIQGIKMPRR